MLDWFHLFGGPFELCNLIMVPYNYRDRYITTWQCIYVLCYQVRLKILDIFEPIERVWPINHHSTRNWFNQYKQIQIMTIKSWGPYCLNQHSTIIF